MAAIVRLSSVCRRGVKPLFYQSPLLARPLVVPHKHQDQPYLLTARIHASQALYAGSGTKAASLHWTAERVLSVVLLAMGPVAYFNPGPAMDYSLAAALTLHGHWLIPLPGLKIRLRWQRPDHVLHTHVLSPRLTRQTCFTRNIF
ncbi:succinate dehydrogenase [ubiquinone] cytochrome b small subunit B, mitochondrial isoform X2 [Micropterus salmoides]|uniref:succinate dehydrogenase [ubiquinone] cytochrome b small subunit B, mitochondrial isoform X2 n=1 Tax=Micropterus salmoides TaxID=27706 RepID=UPI0018EAF241|nr:succinate dehydrogenase [ubiquinone] cytochrome b small subunit B, mitochondrial isoform X2 [Micropterus salmoides]